MTGLGAAARPRSLLLPAALLAGLATATLLRVAVAGTGLQAQLAGPVGWTDTGFPGAAGSQPAGLAFAGCLLALCIAAGQRPRRPPAGALLAGVAGGAVLCLPALLHRLGADGHLPGGGFLPWALVVTVVATAEEVFLRGALYDAVAARGGPVLAVGIGALAFALLHLPLYGWSSLPLDAAVGIWLGTLRVVTGSVAAPAAAHVIADWAGFWLR
jgi:membrane protease YdiL (CAAX protease family)